jgi:hypothetical protein
MVIDRVIALTGLVPAADCGGVDDPGQVEHRERIVQLSVS